MCLTGESILEKGPTLFINTGRLVRRAYKTRYRRAYKTRYRTAQRQRLLYRSYQLIDFDKVQSMIEIGSSQHAANRYQPIISTPLDHMLRFLNNVFLSSCLSSQTVQTQMKCCILLHFIWVFTVCQSTHLGMSSIQRAKRNILKFEYSLNSGGSWQNGHDTHLCSPRLLGWGPGRKIQKWLPGK